MKLSDPHPVLVIAGPTASGKSRLALAAALEFGGTVINADGMQVYRELSILSARPTPEDAAKAPHRLFGVLSVAERCSAGRWLGMAEAEIGAAWDGGRLPIVAGGTGLYLKALMQGLARVPPVPESAAVQARDLYLRLGGEAFRNELRRLDPEAAEKLAAKDRQRLVRAYAVASATGRTLASWQREHGHWPGPGGRLGGARFQAIALMPPTAELYGACDARFERMLALGALDEARAIQRLGLEPGLPAAKAVGLAELLAHLRGELSLEQAVALAKRATRNFAKRQNTWLRHQMAGAKVYCAQFSESIRDEIFSFIRRFLLTGRT